MTKTRLTKQDESDLHAARMTLMHNRDTADAGNENAKRLVRQARETISRLTAKRDGKMWL